MYYTRDRRSAVGTTRSGARYSNKTTTTTTTRARHSSVRFVVFVVRTNCSVVGNVYRTDGRHKNFPFRRFRRPSLCTGNARFFSPIVVWTRRPPKIAVDKHIRRLSHTPAVRNNIRSFARFSVFHYVSSVGCRFHRPSPVARIRRSVNERKRRIRTYRITRRCIRNRSSSRFVSVHWCILTGRARRTEIGGLLENEKNFVFNAHAYHAVPFFSPRNHAGITNRFPSAGVWARSRRNRLLNE